MYLLQNIITKKVIRLSSGSGSYYTNNEQVTKTEWDRRVNSYLFTCFPSQSPAYVRRLCIPWVSYRDLWLHKFNKKPIFAKPVVLEQEEFNIKGYCFYDPKREVEEKSTFYSRLYDMKEHLEKTKIPG